MFWLFGFSVFLRSTFVQKKMFDLICAICVSFENNRQQVANKMSFA